MFFHAAQSGIDTHSCRDKISLQTLFLLSLALLSVGNVWTASSYLNTALHACFSLGYHQPFHDVLDHAEKEDRKCLFWSIFKIDLCVRSFLGLPIIYAESNIMQEPFHATIGNLIFDDPALDQLQLATLMNYHTDLMFILAKLMQQNEAYVRRPPLDDFFAGRLSEVLSIQEELDLWQFHLDGQLKKVGTIPSYLEK
jgi:hypothetical protein